MGPGPKKLSGDGSLPLSLSAFPNFPIWELSFQAEETKYSIGKLIPALPLNICRTQVQVFFRERFSICDILFTKRQTLPIGGII